MFGNLREKYHSALTLVTTLGFFAGMHQFVKDERAQLGGIGGALIAIMIAVIIGVAVCIPVITNVTEQAGLTGTTKTIVELLPLMIASAGRSGQSDFEVEMRNAEKGAEKSPFSSFWVVI